MKIRFLSPTHIRRSIQDLSLPPIGIIHAGTEMEVKDRLFSGQEIDGVNTFFQDHHGWYFWSGRAVIMYKALPSPQMEAATNIPEEENSEYIGGSWILTTEVAVDDENDDDTPEVVEDILVDETPTTILSPPPPPPPVTPRFTPPPITTTRSVPSPVVAPLRKMNPPPSASPSTQLHWQYESGMLPWGPVSDQVPTLLWERFGLSGKNITIGFIDTTPWDPRYNSRQIRMQKNWANGRNNRFSEEAADYSLSSMLIGNPSLEWEGLVPNAQLILATVENPSSPNSPQQLLDAFSWVQAQSVDIIAVNGYWSENHFKGEILQQFQALTTQFARQGRLLFAPVGEGRGLRPVNNWPSADPNCFSIGAYQANGQPSPFNQQTNSMDLLGPAESEVFPFPEYSPSGIATVYASGISALLMELVRESDLNWGQQEWQALFRQGANSGAIAQTAASANAAVKLNVPALVQRIAATANNW